MTRESMKANKVAAKVYGKLAGARIHNAEYLVGLAKYALGYAPFVEGLLGEMTVERFCRELSEEIRHHHELDVEQGIVES